MEIRSARKQDAHHIAHLTNLAGEGISEYYWANLAQGGETPFEVGARRVSRDEGDFSYSNTRVCVEGESVLGMIVAYRQADPYDRGDLSGLPEALHPLVELESTAPGSWYINAVATYEEYRGRGVARRLLADTEVRARSRGCERMSLIVSSENAAARRLYDRLGFEAVRTLPVIPWPDAPHGGDWILLTRAVSVA
jgi:ribosomal protein S18 acetylase RimI-like enzyme